MTRLCIVLVAAGGISLAAAQADLGGPERSAPQILSDAAGYVRTYQSQLLGMTAEEDYTQTSTTAGSTAKRTQKSDVLLLARVAGADAWVQFRDVFEVDGRPVRDRDDRLAKLFLNPSGSALEQLRAISEESTRYNIGVERTINNPILPLLFLDPDNQQRFTFSVTPPARSTGPGGSARRIPRDMPASPAFEVPADAIEVRYKETQKGTIVHTGGDRDLPASGRFWVETATGRVLATDVVFDDQPTLRARLSVAYQPGPSGTLLVPREMREEYTTSATVLSGSVRSVRRTVVSGVALYSNFRQFQVHTEEQIDTGQPARGRGR